MLKRLLVILVFCLTPAWGMCGPISWCGSEWTTYTYTRDPHASMQAYLSGGDLCFASPNATTYTELWATPNIGSISDFEMSASIIGDSDDLDWSGGLVWGLHQEDGEWRDAYYFAIAQSSFKIVKKINYQHTEIVGWTYSPAVHSNSADVNLLRVRRVGSQHTLWINGVLVYRFTDGELGSGLVALHAQDTQPFLVRFRQFQLTHPTAAKNWQLYP